MSNVKTTAMMAVDLKSVYWFTALTASLLIIPHYVHNQFITGPIVNAILFLAVIKVGLGNAVMIGLLPSVAALVSGLLPTPLAPMIPFIMISNGIMVLTFSYFNKINYWSGVLGGALLKYAFLFLTSTIVVKLISNNTIAAKASAVMMAWPQIITAVAGGVIAYGIIKGTKYGQSTKE